jgi:hypothetical protein
MVPRLRAPRYGGPAALVHRSQRGDGGRSRYPRPLVGLSFTAVLTDDQAGDRLEHLACPHHGAGFELRRGDGALARCGGDADQVLCRVLDVGDIPERARARDKDVRAQHQGQDRVGLRRAASDDHDRAPQDTEIQQPVGKLSLAGRHGLEPVGSRGVSAGRDLFGVHHQLDGHGGKRGAGLIDDMPADPSVRLGAGVRSCERKNCRDEQG